MVCSSLNLNKVQEKKCRLRRTRDKQCHDNRLTLQSNKESKKAAKPRPTTRGTEEHSSATTMTPSKGPQGGCE